MFPLPPVTQWMFKEEMGHWKDWGTEEGLCPAKVQQEQEQQVLACPYLFVKKIAGRRQDDVSLLPPLSQIRESITVTLAMQRQGAQEQEGLCPAWAQQE
jgi:hypothetical protein